MAKQSDILAQYLTARPYAAIKASDMFDALGMYTTSPTGHRSYTGGAALADLVKGVQEGSKRGLPRPPLEGLEILEDHFTNHGSGGHSWPKMVLKYAPPRPVDTVTGPVLAAIEAGVTVEDLTPMTPVLDGEAILAELRQVNFNLEALLSLQREAWGGSQQVFDPSEVLPQDEPGKTPGA